MTVKQGKAEVIAIKALLERDEDFVRSAVQSFVQAALEAEMTDALGAGKSERIEGRLGYRSGYYSRALITRVGTHVAGRFFFVTQDLGFGLQGGQPRQPLTLPIRAAVARDRPICTAIFQKGMRWRRSA